MASLTFAITLLSLPIAILGQNCTLYSPNNYVCNVNGATPLTALSMTGVTTSPLLMNITDINGAVTSLFSSIPATITSTSLAYSTTIFSMHCAKPQGTFSNLAAADLTGLKYNMFVIQDCRIDSLPASYFSNTPNVTHIEINGGTIDAIDQNFLKDLVFLSGDPDSGHLTLYDVQIANATLPSGVFNKAANLRFLTLKNLGLTSFVAGMISGCPTLTYLDLTGNQLTVLSNGLFDNLPISTFIAFNNPWDCKCDKNYNIWLMDWSFSNRVNVQASLTCHSPSDMQGIRMYHMNQTTCAVGTPYDPWDIVVGFFLVICFLCIIFALYVSSALVKLLREPPPPPEEVANKVTKWREEDRKPIINEIEHFRGYEERVVAPGFREDDRNAVGGLITVPAIEHRRAPKKKVQEDPPPDMTLDFYPGSRPTSGKKTEKHVSIADEPEKKDSGKVSPGLPNVGE